MPGYELYGAEERAALLEWFDASNGVMFAHGFDQLRNGVYKVREFEALVAQTVDSKCAQAVSSGTAALLTALKAMGVGPGDEVITQSFTFIATVGAIIAAGATPVIAEIDQSLNMNPKSLQACISPRTKVVIPVHMAGAAADMDSILEISQQHGLLVLEDAAQCFGGTYKGKPLGTLGDVGIYSFDFGKTITTGEGGMVVTDNVLLFEKARAYQDHGHEYNPNFPKGQDTASIQGFNFRLTEVQAALGITQLGKLEYILERQRGNKAAIKSGIAGCGFEFRKLHDPDGDIGDSLVFFLKSTEKAELFMAELANRGVGAKNLPGSIDWHFAGRWDHLESYIKRPEQPAGSSASDDPSFCACYSASGGCSCISYLDRAIELGINVNMSAADIDHFIGSLKSTAKQVL